jgi:hypothetical protein
MKHEGIRHQRAPAPVRERLRSDLREASQYFAWFNAVQPEFELHRDVPVDSYLTHHHDAFLEVVFYADAYHRASRFSTEPHTPTSWVRIAKTAFTALGRQGMAAANIQKTTEYTKDYGQLDWHHASMMGRRETALEDDIDGLTDADYALAVVARQIVLEQAEVVLDGTDSKTLIVRYSE